MGPPELPSRCADTDQTPGLPCRPTVIRTVTPRGLGDAASRLAWPPHTELESTRGLFLHLTRLRSRRFTGQKEPQARPRLHRGTFRPQRQAAPSGSWGPGADAQQLCSPGPTALCVLPLTTCRPVSPGVSGTCWCQDPGFSIVLILSSLRAK